VAYLGDMAYGTKMQRIRGDNLHLQLRSGCLLFGLVAFAALANMAFCHTE